MIHSKSQDTTHRAGEERGMNPLSKRTRRGLAEAILHPVILGVLLAVLLTLEQWLESVA